MISDPTTDTTGTSTSTTTLTSATKNNNNNSNELRIYIYAITPNVCCSGNENDIPNNDKYSFGWYYNDYPTNNNKVILNEEEEEEEEEEKESIPLYYKFSDLDLQQQQVQQKGNNEIQQQHKQWVLQTIREWIHRNQYMISHLLFLESSSSSSSCMIQQNQQQQPQYQQQTEQQQQQQQQLFHFIGIDQTTDRNKLHFIFQETEQQQKQITNEILSCIKDSIHTGGDTWGSSNDIFEIVNVTNPFNNNNKYNLYLDLTNDPISDWIQYPNDIQYPPVSQQQQCTASYSTLYIEQYNPEWYHPSFISSTIILVMLLYIALYKMCCKQCN